MEKDLVNIISEKKYAELTQEELTELQDYCAGEEEYEQMREVFLAMNMMETQEVRPSEKVKDDLDALFDQQYPRAATSWYMSALSVIAPKEKTFFQQPLVRIAAVALLFLIIYPVVNNTLTVKQDQKMAKVEAKKNDKSFVQEEIKPEREETKADLEQTIEAENFLVETEESGSAEELDDSEIYRDEMVARQPTLDATTTLSPTFSSTRFDNTVTAGSAADSDFSGFMHPDGVYIPSGNAEVVKSESVAASKSPELLDLLTATF